MVSTQEEWMILCRRVTNTPGSRGSMKDNLSKWSDGSYGSMCTQAAINAHDRERHTMRAQEVG